MTEQGHVTMLLTYTIGTESSVNGERDQRHCEAKHFRSHGGALASA